jgi:hypothetical protein
MEVFTRRWYELGIPNKPKIDFIFFEHTNLSLDDFDSRLTGKVVKLVEKTYGPNKMNVGAVVNSFIIQAIKRSSNRESITTLDEAIKKRGLTPQHVTDWLSGLRPHVSGRLSWSDIAPRLNEYDIFEYRAIMEAFADHDIERLNPDNHYLKSICSAMISILQQHKGTGLTLCAIIDSSVAALRQTGIDLTGHDDNYLKAVALYEFCTNKTW